MFASAQASLGEYGPLMKNLETCMDNLGRKVREGMGSCGCVTTKGEGLGKILKVWRSGEYEHLHICLRMRGTSGNTCQGEITTV